jgi:FtsP/CotA-like multicopper oxidase with cupredoxin domain
MRILTFPHAATPPRKLLISAGAALVSGLLLLTGGGSSPAAAGPPADGVVCTYGSEGQSATTQTFTLTARAGHITTPDGNTVYMWGFADGKGTFQYPGPNLCVKQGDRVRVVLKNTLPAATSIIFPGQTGVTADGVAAAPVLDNTGAITSLTPTAEATNGSVTYGFIADAPGTYVYKSGTNEAVQTQMGLFGALLVRPAQGATFAYNSARSEFDPKTEFVQVLSDLDPAIHIAVAQGRTPNMEALHPRYWMINGRSFPDTIAPNHATWLPYQPYNSLIHTVANPSKPAIVRYINVTGVSHPMHPHGDHGRVIARDGALLAGPNGEDLSHEDFAIEVGPGQTVDALYGWEDTGAWSDPSAAAHPTLPDQAAPLDLLHRSGDTWWSGSRFLGVKDAAAMLGSGITVYNQCGEYYQVSHSHALNEVTNYGAAMGGMLTLWRIDPINHFDCA